MQKLAGLITEGQYKQLIENKQGDKVEGGYVLASPDDNEITDAEFDALLALCDGATEDNFLVVSKTKPEYGVNYSGKQLVDLIKKGAAEIICKEKVNEAESNLIILLYSLRNSINSENKEESLSKLEGILSTVRDMEDAQLTEIEGDNYYGYNEPMSQKDINKAYADGYGDEENQLADIIEDNKAALAKQFNLVNPMVSWNAEGEPVMMTDDNDEQVDFIKVEDWENNKGFYSRSNTMGEITLDGIDIIYVVNPY